MRTAAWVPRSQLGLLAAVTLVVAACSTSAKAGTAPALPNAQGSVAVRQGGTLIFGSGQAPSSFNPNTARGSTFTDQMIMDRVWPQVFLLSPELGPVLDDAFVENAELVSTSPQTIVYNINPRATWSDGVPISADDFIYNWKAQNGSGTDVDGRPYDAATTAGYSDIQSVTSSNAGKTVTVVFKQPYGDWERLFGNLIPAHVAQRVGWNTGFDTFRPAVVVSGGPFMVTSYSPGHELVLARNPRYWGPQANLDKIDFVFVRDRATDPSLLEGGEVGLVYPVPSVDLVQQVKELHHVSYQLGLSLTFEQIEFNERNAFLSDIKVRQAIALATDRNQMAADTVGLYDSYIQPQQDHLFVNTQPQYQNNARAAGYGIAAPTAATRLLQSDGFVIGPDGYFEKDSKTLELNVSTTVESPLRLLLEQDLVSQLRALGIKLDVVNAPTGTLFGSYLPAGNYDIALVPATASVYPSATAAQYETADPASGTGLQNWTGFSDPTVDSLFEQAKVELNEAKAVALYNQIDQVLWAKMVGLPLFPDPTFIAFDGIYGNISDNPTSSGPFWNAEEWGLKVTKKP